MHKNYTTIMSDVIKVCEAKYAPTSDSNWITSMYLDYVNDYISADTFFANEIEPLLDYEYLCEDETARKATKVLLNLFSSIGGVQPHLHHFRVGEIAMKILKGEV